MMLKKAMRKQGKGKGGDRRMEDDAEHGGASAEVGEDEEKQPKEGFMKSLLKDKAAQKIFPVFWLICVSMALFQYLMELRPTSYKAAPTASLLFECGVPLSLLLFASVALMDPGKLPTRAKGHTGVEEIMKALDSGVPESQMPDVSRLCTTTWVLKDLRTKYCTETCACIEEFDHYCIWLNAAIGKNNHRQFFGLAIAEWMTQVVHIYLLHSMALSLVPYESFFSWVFGVITGYPLLFLIALVQCLTAPWICMLIIHQGRLVAMNLTTNEMMNIHRYEHFWQIVGSPGMPMRKEHRNPFNKGGPFRNCFDFWWSRRRSQMVERVAGGCGSPGCEHDHHGHSHA